MRITFAPRGILQIDGARLMYRNFRGEGSKFNREGDREFSVVIETQEQADALIEAGWNVKIKPPTDGYDEPLMYMKVKVKFNDRGPNVWLKTSGKKVRLSEDTIACLDNIYVLEADMDIRPYDWEMPSGLTGRAAYLQSICVTQDIRDRFAEDEYPTE